MAISARTKRWTILLFLLVAAVAGLRLGRNWIATKALHNVARMAEKGGYIASFEEVEFSLFEKHIRITGLSIAPRIDTTTSDSGSTFTIRAGAIDLRGVDVRALIQQNVLHVGHVLIHTPEIEHVFITQAGKKGKKPKTERQASKPQGLAFLHVDTLLISNATGRSQDRTKGDPAVSIGEVDLLITTISITNDVNGKPLLSIGTASVELRQAQAHLEPFYSLRVDSIRVLVPQDSAVVFGLHFTPEVSPRKYHKEVDTQVELYEAHVDTILLSGFDLDAKLEDGALLAEALYVGGIQVDVYRDKSIPVTVERPRKALLAEKVQGWELPVSLGNVAIERGKVTYHERLKQGDDYGALTLGSINATLTGITNGSADGSVTLHLNGSARLWDKAKADLDLRMTRDTGPTQVNAHVTMRELPATELNRMTDDLVHVSATEGRIHFVEMQLTGDDIQGHGRVVMHYEDLKLALSPSVKHAGLLSFAANTVVRTDNMPGDKRYRIGHFQVQRKQETSVFNYLWIGLREGMMEVMLPPQVLKQLRKQQAKKH